MSTMARDEEFIQIKKEAINKEMEWRKNKIQDILQKRILYLYSKNMELAQPKEEFQEKLEVSKEEEEKSRN